jgi:hypothetical protein
MSNPLAVAMVKGLSAMASVDVIASYTLERHLFTEPPDGRKWLRSLLIETRNTLSLPLRLTSLQIFDNIRADLLSRLTDLLSCSPFIEGGGRVSSHAMWSKRATLVWIIF